MNITSVKILKIIITILAIVALTYFTYWLWQRQPREVETTTKTNVAQDQIVEKEEKEATISITPQDGKILESTDVDFQITAGASSYVVILADNFENIIKTNSSGQAKIKLTLKENFNLIKIIILSQDFTKSQEKELALFVKSQITKTSAQTVAAGTVKNLFQNTITLTSTQGEKEIKTNAKTQTALSSPTPTKSPQPKNSDQNIRIGDYLVILAKSEDKTSIAENIQIYRSEKPQITKQVAYFKLLSVVKKPDNLFSAKDEKNNQLTELNLDKNSQILKDGKKLTSSDLQKDQKAIIVYYPQEDKKIVNFIQLLP